MQCFLLQVQSELKRQGGKLGKIWGGKIRADVGLENKGRRKACPYVLFFVCDAIDHAGVIVGY